MRFDQVPTARADHELRHLVAESIGLALGRFEGERAADRVDQRGLPTDHVRPGRRQRVLEVGHEDPRSRVEGVDHHLRLGGTGDLDPSIVEVGWRRRDRPIGLADVARARREVEPLARIQCRLPLMAPMEQVDADVAEAALQVGDERQCLVREDALATVDLGTCDDDTGRWHHDTSDRRIVASMSPWGSVVAT